jgi:subtilisin family serine protease
MVMQSKRILIKLRNVGVATVIASGNEYNVDGVSSPACVSSAIAVGSTLSYNSGGAVDSVSWFSNAPTVANNKPNIYGDRLLDLLAPGQYIYSSVGYPVNQYEAWAGTSMATPHVAGAWAVIKGLTPNASVAQVLTWLRDNGVPVADQRMAASSSISRAADSGGQGDYIHPKRDAHIATINVGTRLSGEVRVGDAVVRSIVATSPYTSTTFTWDISGAGFAVDVPNCDDYIDYACTLNVIYTPSLATNNINDTGILTVTWVGFRKQSGYLAAVCLVCRRGRRPKP